VRAAYGEPDAEWVGTFDTLHYYGEQSVIFTIRHPKGIRPAVYDKARGALGQLPSGAPDSHVVTGITVIRPFTVSTRVRRR
jgi:hypothetical protein